MGQGRQHRPKKFGEDHIGANSSGRIGKDKFLSVIKREKFSKIGNDEQEFGYYRAFRLPYIYRMQYVILIPRFFLTKHSSRAIRADRLCPPQNDLGPYAYVRITLVSFIQLV